MHDVYGCVPVCYCGVIKSRKSNAPLGTYILRWSVGSVTHYRIRGTGELIYALA